MGTRIITISRQCGSGGHEIGELVAKRLGMKFYDKELVKAVAERSGFSEEIIESKGEAATQGFFFNIGENRGGSVSAADRSSMPLSDQINAYQAEFIRELADWERCVIVGRCANYVLRKRQDCLHVYIYGSLEDRVARVMRTHGVQEETARSHIVERDKKRAKYYKYQTNRVWGQAENYNLCLDVSRLGLEQCVEILAAICGGDDAVNN